MCTFFLLAADFHRIVLRMNPQSAPDLNICIYIYILTTIIFVNIEINIDIDLYKIAYALVSTSQIFRFRAHRALVPAKG